MKVHSIYVYKTEPKVKVRVNDSGRMHTVFIEPCQDSWEQYGAQKEVLFFTMPLAEKLSKMNYFRRFKRTLADGVKESLQNTI